MIRKLALIGTGLIGGSLSLALKKAKSVEEVWGYSRNEKNLQKGVELGVLDQYSLELKEVVKEADMVVLAVPVGVMESYFQQLAPIITESCVLTDVGSAKSEIMHFAKTYLPVAYTGFVPGHPIAGTENSGIESGLSDLFQDRKVILTPNENTNHAAIDVVSSMWQTCGANIELMSAEHHDQVFAATSHLPHVLAFSLVNKLSAMEDSIEIFKYAAGGFRDFTRIASSDPLMWKDICIQNKQSILQVLGQYMTELSSMSAKIEASDEEQLLEYFMRAKNRRDELIGRC